MSLLSTAAFELSGFKYRRCHLRQLVNLISHTAIYLQAENDGFNLFSVSAPSETPLSEENDLLLFNVN